MEMDHKEVSTELTKRVKLLAEEYRKREYQRRKGQMGHGGLEEGVVKVRSQKGTTGS